jgi:prevent-host-death family protein
MKHVNALELRQSLGRVVAALQKTGEPILLEKGRKPAAVLISLKDYNERFVEKAAAEERSRIIAEIDALKRPSADKTSVVSALREARTGAK